MTKAATKSKPKSVQAASPLDKLLADCPTLSDYIIRHQVDAVLWKAEQLLGSVPESDIMLKNNRAAEIAGTIAKMPESQQVIKDEYIKRIATSYHLDKKTLAKLVNDQTEIEGKKAKFTKSIRKNTPVALNGNAKTFPFFVELIDPKKKEFKGIKIDKLKFVQLLGSFGFTRFANESDTKYGYTFVRLLDNVITEVSAEEMKDFMEDFLRKDYDFDGAGCDHADAEMLINVFYDNLGKYFSNDLFARVRNASPIIINRDTATECFLYFKNGFVKITKEDYELIGYEKLDGSVWQKQMLERSFKKLSMEMATKEENGHQVPDLENSFTTDLPLGDFADFIWRICGMKQQRFVSLCSIIGYLVHDFYNYKLKAILFTDSAISDLSEGRTGKTLLGKMLALVRSMTEINGKDFDAKGNKNKYEDVNRSTQIVHLNDVRNRGTKKFDFEDIFNDITEGFMVNAKFRTPFRHIAKIIISSNRTLPIEGESQRDRIVEFEMSNFFNAARSPLHYYKHWFGQDWDEAEFNRFDNFICFCVQVFLTEGLISPDTINLEARKLRDQTAREFLEFMADIADCIKTTGLPWNGYADQGIGFERVSEIEDFEFDKNKLYYQFLQLYPDFKANHFTQRRFSDWLKVYSRLQVKAEPTERRSNGMSFIQFKALKTK